MMSKTLQEALQQATPRLTAEQLTALAFAKLELTELQAGIRSLDQCPGLKAMARHIYSYENRRRQSTQRAAERKRKTHFVAVHDDGKALCGAQTSPAYVTDQPDAVTCLFCRRFNLQSRAAERARITKV